MATYLFKCKKCKRKDIKIDLPMTFGDYKNIKCPYCGSRSLKKVITVPSISTGTVSGNTSSCSTGNCCVGGNCN